MSGKQNTLAFQWFQQVWNEDREELIDELLAHEAIVHDITDVNGPKGPEGFKIFYHEFRNQFSSVYITVEDVVSEGNLESARCTVTAKHNDTGRNVQFTGICMIRKGNGQIEEAWNSFDFLKLNMQISN